MPITARFSSRVCERLGDDVAEGLVNWLNTFDQDYARQLVEINDRNWARFSDRLDARAVMLEAKIETVEARIDARLAELRAQFEAKLDAREARLLRWLFLFWAGTTIPLATLNITLSRA